MAGRRKYQFLKKKEAPDAKLSIWFSLASLVTLIILTLVSFAYEGNGGTALGAVGLLAALVAFYAFYLGMRVLVKRDPEYRLPAFSAVFSGTMSIVWIAMFLWGLR